MENEDIKHGLIIVGVIVAVAVGGYLVQKIGSGDDADGERLKGLEWQIDQLADSVEDLESAVDDVRHYQYDLEERINDADSRIDFHELLEH